MTLSRQIDAAEAEAQRALADLRTRLDDLVQDAEHVAGNCGRLTAWKKEGEHVAWALRLAQEQLKEQEPPSVRLVKESA